VAFNTLELTRRVRSGGLYRKKVVPSLYLLDPRRRPLIPKTYWTTAIGKLSSEDWRVGVALPRRRHSKA
jgi:hypothetical protein